MDQKAQQKIYDKKTRIEQRCQIKQSGYRKFNLVYLYSVNSQHVI